MGRAYQSRAELVRAKEQQVLRPLAPNGPGTVFRLMIRRLAAGGGCDGEGRGNAEKTEQMGLSNISMVIGACGELYFFRHDLEGLQVGS